MTWAFSMGLAQVLMGLTLSVCLADSVAGGEQKVAKENDEKIIELRIVVPKTEVTQDEKFKVTVEFENKYYHPIVFYWYIDGFTDFVTLIITEPNGERVVIDRNLSSKLPLKWHSFTLKPGEKRAREIPGELYCTQLGTVTFEAEFKYLGIKTRAEPVKVVVKPKNP
jgi:hypothetical protein